MEEALAILQDFDPAGIGARSLQECLALQLRRKMDEGGKNLPLLRTAKRIVDECYEEFTRKHWEKITKKLGIGEETLRQALAEITRLNPRPGASLGEAMGKNLHQIVPDFIVETYDDGTISLSLNNHNVPELRMNRDFADMLREHTQGKARPSKEAKEGFARWIARTVALIKQLDPNHLVSTGSEGLYGCEVDADLCERIHNDLNIDYYTIHIWPRNWQWVAVDRLVEDLPNAYLRSGEYIDLHQRMASKAGKPLVIEEFGYPRDYNNYSRQSTTGARDGYYSFIFNRLLESYRHQGILAGCNFWGWGGEAVADSTAWMPGADYMVDPPHEPQGWYSVFDEDYSTIQIIEQTVAALKP